MNTNLLTQERLQELVNYDPVTGIFTWRLARRKCTPGKLAGCRMNTGYWCIRIDDVLHTAHRLAWLYMTGSFPPQQIDHINNDRGDNRFCNLRIASNAENAQNRRGVRKNNTSGHTGVRLTGGKWVAEIKINYKSTRLGTFSTKEEAIAVYEKARQELHPFSKC